MHHGHLNAYIAYVLLALLLALAVGLGAATVAGQNDESRESTGQDQRS
jgi:hypothetical protein